MIELSIIAGAAVVVLLVVILLVWRNAVYEREATRHHEVTRLLYNIYKAASREN